MRSHERHFHDARLTEDNVLTLSSIADEIRRSGRATKGQHKNLESSAEPTPMPKAKKGAKGKASKKAAEPEEEDDDDEAEAIRCVCGDNSDDVEGRAYIACDSCEVWQHNDCMGVPLAEDLQPDHYFCEQCRPEEHAELLQAIDRGEKIWEERRKAAAGKSKKKGKGKKGGRQSRVSEVKADGSEAPDASTPVPATSQESGTKRKFQEEVPEVYLLSSRMGTPGLTHFSGAKHTSYSADFRACSSEPGR